MQKRILWDFCLLLASSLNYALACVVSVIFRIDPFYYILIVFFFSLMFGIQMTDLKKTLLYTVASLFLGIAIGSVLLVSPTIIYGASSIEVNLAVAVTLHVVSRLFIICMAGGFFGALIGYFVGARLLGKA